MVLIFFVFSSWIINEYLKFLQQILNFDWLLQELLSADRNRSSPDNRVGRVVSKKYLQFFACQKLVNLY